MVEEKQFSDMSRYPKLVDAEWQSAVAEYLEEVGATDLDAPDAPKRKIQRTDAQLCAALEGQKRKEAEARAQAEYREAQARLADGTAIHRQKKERTPVLEKKKAAAPKRKSKAADTRAVAAIRRAGLIKTLNNGGKIKLERKAGNINDLDYQAQYIDIRWIIENHKLDIKRIKSVSANDSYFVLDKFARYQMPEAIHGGADDKDKLLAALLSKQLVLASDITGANKLATATILNLATIHDLDFYTVFDSSRKTYGWIFIMDEEKRKAKLKEVGDLLQALDFLEEQKLRKENDRLPMHVPDVILDAAYREFKRVAKDAGATIEEVLAVKESQ